MSWPFLTPGGIPPNWRCTLVITRSRKSQQVKTIQELLRHATFKVTADTYTQAVTPVKRDAQAKIAKLIMADGSEAKAITPTLQ